MNRQLSTWWRNPSEASLLLIASLFACLMVGVRIYLSGAERYLFLIWNLFLAWIPFLLAKWMTLNKKPDKAFLAGGLILWLLFFPNAPYLITDFLHFKPKNGVKIWFDMMMIFSFAWIGLMLGFSSLRKLQTAFFDKLGTLKSKLLVGIILLLTGFGVYLGRYLRWNSWDIISDPMGLLKDILNLVFHPIENLNATGFTIVFAGFLLIGYMTYSSRFRENA